MKRSMFLIFMGVLLIIIGSMLIILGEFASGQFSGIIIIFPFVFLIGEEVSSSLLFIMVAIVIIFLILFLFPAMFFKYQIKEIPEVGISHIRCPSCGSIVPSSYRYCPICGEKLSTYTA